MLWYKAWLETRWRFVIGLVFLLCSAAGLVLMYPYVATQLAGMADPAAMPIGGSLGAQITEGLSVVREYRGYVWWQWFRQNLRDAWTIFAVLLGTGGLLSQASGGAALFTLSMPASRRHLLGVRAATALSELGVLAVAPTLLIPLLSPVVGQSYSAADALVHAVCLFIGGTVFFSLAFLLSTVFSDVWRPALIAIAVFYAMSFSELASGASSPLGPTTVMAAQTYFRSGELPWAGLMTAVVLSAALIYAAFVNIERRDF